MINSRQRIEFLICVLLEKEFFMFPYDSLDIMRLGESFFIEPQELHVEVNHQERILGKMIRIMRYEAKCVLNAKGKIEARVEISLLIGGLRTHHDHFHGEVSSSSELHQGTLAVRAFERAFGEYTKLKKDPHQSAVWANEKI